MSTNWMPPGPQPTGPYAHQHTTPPKKKRRWWPLAVLAVVVVLFGGCAAIISSATPGGVGNPTPAPAGAIENPPTDWRATAGAPVQQAPTPTNLSNATQFADGEWLVGKGKEVVPGVYRTPGAEAGYCAAIVRKGESVLNAASTNGEGEPARITLKEGQTVQSTGCQPWVKVG